MLYIYQKSLRAHLARGQPTMGMGGQQAVGSLVEAIEDVEVGDPEPLLEIWWRGGKPAPLLELR